MLQVLCASIRERTEKLYQNIHKIPCPTGAKLQAGCNISSIHFYSSILRCILNVRCDERFAVCVCVCVCVYVCMYVCVCVCVLESPALSRR